MQYLIRYDINATRLKEHGPGFRPQDGAERWVGEQFVQDFRDKGWQIIRKATPPYEWCRHPDRCTGGYCPRDPNCGE